MKAASADDKEKAAFYLKLLEKDAAEKAALAKEAAEKLPAGR